MKDKREIMIIDEQSLRDKIYVIRGQQVMLDFDLAMIYGYETRYFNRQVQNNKERFIGDDFMFQLTKEELENLKCNNFTSSSLIPVSNMMRFCSSMESLSKRIWHIRRSIAVRRGN